MAGREARRAARTAWRVAWRVAWRTVARAGGPVGVRIVVVGVEGNIACLMVFQWKMKKVNQLVVAEEVGEVEAKKQRQESSVDFRSLEFLLKVIIECLRCCSFYHSLEENYDLKLLVVCIPMNLNFRRNFRKIHFHCLTPPTESQCSRSVGCVGEVFHLFGVAGVEGAEEKVCGKLREGEVPVAAVGILVEFPRNFLTELNFENSLLLQQTLFV